MKTHQSIKHNISVVVLVGEDCFLDNLEHNGWIGEFVISIFSIDSGDCGSTGI